jgi:methylenetetrahydrofolate dehydrogenase (NADP+) / methenyltetrahydrofolate cyclohydrolase
MGSLFYGKTIAHEIHELVKSEIYTIKTSSQIEPVMAIIKLDKENSLRMAEVRLHTQLANQLGIGVEEILLSPETKEEELLEVIQRCNCNPLIYGILLLLPLPDHINQERVLSAISADKEIEGLQDGSEKQSSVLAALLDVMKWIDFDLWKHRCVFIADDSTLKYNAVIRKVLERAEGLQIPVQTVSREDIHAKEYTRQADLLAVSLQTPGVLDASYIKQDAVIIDFNPILAGERFCEKKGVMVPIVQSSLNVESLLTKAKYVLPAIGGIGPVALANLMRNFLHNYSCCKK